MKARRQAIILDIVRSEPIRSQEQLRRRVKARGFDVTQATLSRDVRDLGLMKGGADGAYRSPEGERSSRTAVAAFARAMSDYLSSVEQVQQMLLLRTGPGQAQSLGVAIDSAGLPEVVGTIAGDDTILVIARDARRARALAKRIREY